MSDEYYPREELKDLTKYLEDCAYDSRVAEYFFCGLGGAMLMGMFNCVQEENYVGVATYSIGAISSCVGLYLAYKARNRVSELSSVLDDVLTIDEPNQDGP